MYAWLRGEKYLMCLSSIKHTIQTFCYKFFFFSKHRTGAVLVEFAIVFPFIAMIILTTIEVGLLMFVQSVIDNAIHTGSRISKTGFTYTGNTREETILEIIRQQVDFVVNMDDFTVSYEFYDGKTGMIGAGNLGLGKGEDLVRYWVTYKHPTITPLTKIWGDKIDLSSYTVVHNEPF